MKLAIIHGDDSIEYCDITSYGTHYGGPRGGVTIEAFVDLATDRQYIPSGASVCEKVAALKLGPVVGPIDAGKILPGGIRGARIPTLDDVFTELRGDDPVNSPSHYTGFSNGAELIDVTENLNFNRGNAVKYLARAGDKDPSKELEDLKKARWYADREIARIEGELA